MTVSPGRSFPLGATVVDGGVNFCVFSRGARRLELLLFDGPEDAEPGRVIPLSAPAHRTYHYWHAFMPGLGPGQVYAYRAAGRFDSARGLRFDAAKLLLDPYGLAVVVPDAYDRGAASRPGDNTRVAMRSVVVDPDVYDWEGDAPLCRPFATTVIYEMHVAGFTRHPSSGVGSRTRGTYAGMIEKIPYLQDLGITAVELMPVFQFDRQDCPPGLVNYWGYSPVSFFAPHAGYSSRRDPLGPVEEFRDLVKALHRAGIEVILDVVYNHTAEGNHEGPTLSLRGLDNETYYLLEPDRARYANYTGTGNTLNANESVVRRLILDSLRYWVRHMHVDGFRFDLASVLSRDESGCPLQRPPILWDIESDPILAGTKLIAEAWDAAGLYQVGSFVGDAWQEWNGRFRDDVRRFVKSDNDTVVAFGHRCFGSPDIYAHKERGPEQSVNFVTSHDGFTLNDLVSYHAKHNEPNGEGGRDGSDANLSWNCGAEGPTADPAVVALRERQMRNFLATLLLSQGVPMLCAGDESARTQHGNNNAYCQDGDLSWLAWDLGPRAARQVEFARRLIRLRLGQPVFHRRSFFKGRSGFNGPSEPDPRRGGDVFERDLVWLRPDGKEFARDEWHDGGQCLGMRLAAEAIEEPDERGEQVQGDTFLILLNAHPDPAPFVLPPARAGASWEALVDTRDWEPGPARVFRPGDSYLLEGRSLAVLRLGGAAAAAGTADTKGVS